LMTARRHGREAPLVRESTSSAMTADVAVTACNLCRASVAENELRWVRDGYAIVRCSTCSLLFRREMPAQDAVSRLYTDEYFAAAGRASKGEGYLDYVADEQVHRRNARRRLKLLQKFVEPRALLDVGCAAGFFLEEARQRGWMVCGVELAPSMVRMARERYGLDIVEGSFADAEFSAESFDCVTMWDYIEHSLDPVGDLRHAHDLLRPGGIVALSTGDVGSLLARLSGRRWHLLTPRHHNYFFSRPTLQQALTMVGFRVRTVTTLASRYPVDYLMHKLQTMSSSSWLERGARLVAGTRVGRVAVPINLFDIVVVVAQRPPR